MDKELDLVLQDLIKNNSLWDCEVEALTKIVREHAIMKDLLKDFSEYGIRFDLTPT